jgi:hypothetical protein
MLWFGFGLVGTHRRISCWSTILVMSTTFLHIIWRLQTQSLSVGIASWYNTTQQTNLRASNLGTVPRSTLTRTFIISTFFTGIFIITAGS